MGGSTTKSSKTPEALLVSAIAYINRTPGISTDSLLRCLGFDATPSTGRFDSKAAEQALARLRRSLEDEGYIFQPSRVFTSADRRYTYIYPPGWTGKAPPGAYAPSVSPSFSECKVSSVPVPGHFAGLSGPKSKKRQQDTEKMKQAIAAAEAEAIANGSFKLPARRNLCEPAGVSRNFWCNAAYTVAANAAYMEAAERLAQGSVKTDIAGKI